jgi:hypothetical protein
MSAWNDRTRYHQCQQYASLHDRESPGGLFGRPDLYLTHEPWQRVDIDQDRMTEVRCWLRVLKKSFERLEGA